MARSSSAWAGLFFDRFARTPQLRKLYRGIVCLYYYPSLVPELFSLRSSIHAWWRDGRLARLAGGDAHRSIDVAMGRDKHFQSDPACHF